MSPTPDSACCATSRPLCLASALLRLFATLWIGGMWTVGYLVAPTLFAMLDDRMLAGNIAGRLFAHIAWIGIGTAIALLVFMAARQGKAALRRALFWVVAAMFACALAGLGIQSEMAALKAGVGSMDVMESAQRGQFAMLHGISSAIYLVQSLLGVWLVAGMRRE